MKRAISSLVLLTHIYIFFSFLFFLWDLFGFDSTISSHWMVWSCLYSQTRWGRPSWQQTLLQLTPQKKEKKMTFYTWHVTPDAWHLKLDTWQLIHDTWHMNVTPGCNDVLKVWRKRVTDWLTEWINEWRSNKGDCRTARAIPGLLNKNMFCLSSKWRRYVSRNKKTQIYFPCPSPDIYFITFDHVYFAQ